MVKSPSGVWFLLGVSMLLAALIVAAVVAVVIGPSLVPSDDGPEPTPVATPTPVGTEPGGGPGTPTPDGGSTPAATPTPTGPPPTSTIEATPATAGSEATHLVSMTLTEGDDIDWVNLQIDYAADGDWDPERDAGQRGADLQFVRPDDVRTIGIDRGGNRSGSAVDVDATPHLLDTQPRKDGSALVLDLSLGLTLNEGDRIVVEFEDAYNPYTAGEYEAQLDVNRFEPGINDTATLTVVDPSEATPDHVIER